MEKKKIVMLLIGLVFLILVGIITYDMARQTQSPWERAKMQRE
jgi:hypothetical protein